MDLSPAVGLAEPIAARPGVGGARPLPAGKLLAGSGGHAYRSHWWEATVWRQALARVLRAEVASGSLDDAAARTGRHPGHQRHPAVPAVSTRARAAAGAGSRTAGPGCSGRRRSGGPVARTWRPEQ